MCNYMAWSPSHPISASSKRRHRPKQSKVQIYRFSRRGCEENVEKDMELMNLKLYLENQSIIEENEKLRKKANLLHQENLALMSEFQKKANLLHQENLGFRSHSKEESQSPPSRKLSLNV